MQQSKNHYINLDSRTNRELCDKKNKKKTSSKRTKTDKIVLFRKEYRGHHICDIIDIGQNVYNIEQRVKIKRFDIGL